jgi:hypothetical protein
MEGGSRSQSAHDVDTTKFRIPRLLPSFWHQEGGCSHSPAAPRACVEIPPPGHILINPLDTSDWVWDEITY